jgi:hypothetical protein
MVWYLQQIKVNLTWFSKSHDCIFVLMFAICASRDI